ncbi:zinc-ribbon domain-containing protein [Marinifilum flexuosum]|uniref:Zinc ribbon family protein n=1 Tax=Marinifilum flexuosum TaxID=1117708 RepID=A0A419X659_9BACT|nr:zinc-ribbon domain-containing protein [Marinifilum flexuosum]RKE03182.1 zinc ribbon family protein [Marinifilum flexuosum]
MIFIFGANDKVVEKQQQYAQEHCYNCNNTSNWILEKNATYASLFFISVFPIKTRYIYYCPICRNGRQLEKEEYERMR